MRQKIRDIIFLILGITLTILFFTVVIPVLTIIGLIKVISMIRRFKTHHKFVKINP